MNSLFFVHTKANKSYCFKNFKKNFNLFVDVLLW